MMKLSEMSVEELTGIEYNCSCGRIHSVDIDVVDISKNALGNAVEYILKKKYNPVTILCDENTFKVAGKDLSFKLTETGITVNTHILKGRNGLNVAPNDACIGETLTNISADTPFIIAVGSGVINDIARQISYKMGVDYIIVGTAPSMDGYASVTSSLVINNIKKSIQGHCPRGIFGPIDILKNAPFEMLTAGFGDVIGKYNAIREWQFGRDMNGEHYCPEIAKMVKTVVDKCCDNAENLIKRDEETVMDIMNGLVLAGMAMGLYQNTRPASGAEHHMVHYWDVDAIKNGREHELHGNSVGIGTVVICRLFELAKNYLPVEVQNVSSEEIRELLLKAGCKTHPKEAGITRQLFKESIMQGHTMSSKFTILTYLALNKPKLLEEMADKLCIEYYGEI